MCFLKSEPCRPPSDGTLILDLDGLLCSAPHGPRPLVAAIAAVVGDATHRPWPRPPRDSVPRRCDCEWRPAMMPSSAPVSSMTRTSSRTRLVCPSVSSSSRRWCLPLSNAITTSPSAALPAGQKIVEECLARRRQVPGPGGCGRSTVAPPPPRDCPAPALYESAGAVPPVWGLYSTRARALSCNSVAMPALAASRWRSAMGSTTAWTGASQDGERAGVVLDQKRNQAFEAAIDGAVDDDGACARCCRRRFIQVEAMGTGNRAGSSRTATC